MHTKTMTQQPRYILNREPSVSLHTVHMQHLKSNKCGTGMISHCVRPQDGGELGRIYKVCFCLCLLLNLVMFFTDFDSHFHFLFTAAGMAGPVHGAWSERPDENLVLQRGVQCSGPPQCSPGTAHQRQALGWRALLLHGQHQHHHTSSSGAEPSQPHTSTYCTKVFWCISLKAQRVRFSSI